MMFRAFIQGESETITTSPRVARAAYAELLSRDDLIGQQVTAVLERDGCALLISDFAAALGLGRIHPEAPIDVYASKDAARTVGSWRPSVC